MSISLHQTLTAFKRYDKQNVLHYVMLLIVLFSLCLFANPKTISGITCLTIIGLIIYSIANGYYVVVSNNEIHNRKNLFPSIFELPLIVTEGIKYSFGIFIINIIVMAIPISIISLIGFLSAVYFLEQKSFVVGACLIVITVLICIAAVISLYYFFISPLCLMYLKSFKFSSFFAFNKTNLFRRQRGSKFQLYILYIFLIFGLIYIFSYIATSITEIAGTSKGVKDIEFYAYLISSFISTILQTLLIPNLHGQVVRYNVADETFVENYEDYYDEDEYEEMFNDEYEKEEETEEDYNEEEDV